ncbi:MAG: hypothetical protein AAGH64_00450, partial [Planctomycetota bacterium]
MPHRTALTCCALLSFLGACASDPADRQYTASLPEVPDRGIGVGLDEQADARLRGDEDASGLATPEMSDVSTQRSLNDWLANASRPVVDLDTITPTPAARTPIGEGVAAAPPAEQTASSGPAPVPAPNSLDPLVGGPANVFATVDAQPELDDAPAGDVTQDLSTLLAALERMTGDEALSSGLPLGPALRAAALEVITPGALERALGELDDDAPFTPDERALLRAWADLHREVNLA